jgi:hypothetical protein
MAYLAAPAPTTYWVSVNEYGRATFPDGTSDARTKMWLIHPNGSTEVNDAVLRVATNHPTTGRPTYRDFTSVTGARTRGGTTIVDTVDGTFTIVRAPCVCGAGAVGMVGPQPEGSTNYSVNLMRVDALTWLTAG